MGFAIGLDTLIALLKRHRMLLLVGPLFLALGVQSCRLASTQQHLKIAKLTIDQLEQASEHAQAMQIALNLDNQDLAQRIADEARDRDADLASATAAAVSDYAARHRVRPQACRSVGSQASAATVPSDPAAPGRTDEVDMVAVPRRDFEALSADAVRGAQARAFLIDLANEGLAVVD